MLQIEDSPRKNMTAIARSSEISTPFLERTYPWEPKISLFQKQKTKKKPSQTEWSD